MRTDQVERSLVTSDVQGQASFAISSTHQTEIMVILRDSLYSNKILAVIREYCANAWDAHVCAGKGDLPIKVTLPTTLEPVFTVRDYGYGLSEEDVLEVYTQYGASSKRNSNEVVGALGIGSKSAFCYTDQFTVTSWHNGRKSVYVATLDPSNVGVMQKLTELACDEDDSGVQIQIAVNARDTYDFIRYASSALAFFVPPPNTNIKLNEIDFVESNEHGFLINSCRCVAVMGCVSYELDLGKVQSLLPSGVNPDRFYGGLRFQIGEVEVSASREMLKYSDVTKRAIAVKYLKFTEAITAQIELKLNDDRLSQLARRNLAGELVKTIGSWRSLLAAEWASTTIMIPEEYNSVFQVLRPERRDAYPMQKIIYSTELSFYLKERKTSVASAEVPHRALIVVPAKDVTMEVATAAFTAFLAEARIAEVPLLAFSSLPKKFTHAKRGERSSNIKYIKRCFEYSGGNWIPTARVPDESDVYTILTRFKPDTPRLDLTVNELRKAFAAIGRVMPAIIGYKTTDTHPVTTCVGTHMNMWLAGLHATLTVNEDAILQEARVLLVLRNLEQRRQVLDYVQRTKSRPHASGSPMRVLQDLYEAAVALRERRTFDAPLVAQYFSAKNAPLTPLEEQHELVISTYPLLEVACGRYGYGIGESIYEYVELIDQRNKKLNDAITEEMTP